MNLPEQMDKSVVESSELASRVAALPALSKYKLWRPHPLLLSLRNEELTVLLMTVPAWERREVLGPFTAAIARAEAAVVLIGKAFPLDLEAARNRGLLSIVPATGTELVLAVESAFELLETKQRAEHRGKWLNHYRSELGELVEIARAIATEREVDTLLSTILEKARLLTGADAGSIYVVEGDDPLPMRRNLRFKLSQNDSVRFDSREFTIPLSASSMAGYAALHRRALNIPDAYELPSDAPYSFDASFDKKAAYRTKSVLSAPLFSRVGDVIGVLQLINKKRDFNKRIENDADVEQMIVPFDTRSEGLLMTLGAHAGISLENALLYEDIRRMLEGFVRASVEAIEQRDPTTSGHSKRVADFTVRLAKAVEAKDTGPYRDISFSRDEIQELEYASLLHDFGKIGVREEVLVKAKKLNPLEVERIRYRFEAALRAFEIELLQRKMRFIESGGDRSDLSRFDKELASRRSMLRAALDLVTTANEPTILHAGEFSKIEALENESFVDLDGQVRPLLTREEVESLSIARGSLTHAEIEEIRGHVKHTYEFLSRIPWGRQFRRVAQIAGAHHERLDGTGYPNRLRAEEIPIQSKLMSISDIFDALTAKDRPYKKAVPVPKAIDILWLEVKEQHLDPELVQIFCEAHVWETVAR